MEDAIRNFNKQFAWKAAVENVGKLPKIERYILNGMGGSHLAADLLRAYRPEIDLSVFSDYGLPPLLPPRLTNTLFIASSFSGNTEEAIDFAEQAHAKKLAVAVIAKGGRLLEFAQKHKLPHVVLPPVNIQPRSGTGFQMLALAALIGDVKLQKELSGLASTLKPDSLEGKGKKLAQILRDKVPVIYASTRNRAIAYNWKIKFNETGKIPAFYNILPELNHNEMTGFDVTSTTKGLSRKLHFIFFTDSADHPQIRKRMQITRKLYEERGLPVTEVALGNNPPAADGGSPFGKGKTTPVLADSDTPLTKGDNRLEKIFSSLLIADWTALHLSKIYGTEAEQVPMVEEFKRLIA